MGLLVNNAKHTKSHGENRKIRYFGRSHSSCQQGWVRESMASHRTFQPAEGIHERMLEGTTVGQLVAGLDPARERVAVPLLGGGEAG